MSDKKIVAAAAQTAVIPGDIKTNFRIIAKQIQRAASKGIDLLVFPELVDRGYVLNEYRDVDFKEYYVHFQALHKLAQESDIAVIWGNSFPGDNGVMNALLYTDKNTPVTPVYFKKNLFPGEEQVFQKGIKSSRYKMPLCELGFQVCFDIRFPETMRSYLPAMPEVIVISAAWPLARISHWKDLLMARAIENQCYIVASNRVGEDSGIRFGGTSLIITPQGEIIAEAGSDSDELIYHSLDIQELKSYRHSFPVLNHE